MSRSLFFVGLLAGAALLATGCGGSDPVSLPEFQQAVVITRDRADFSLARITKAKSKEEFFNRMNEAADTIDDAAGDLSDVGAPDGYTAPAAKLVDSLEQLAVDLTAFAADASQPGGEGLLTGARGLNFDSWDNANSALSKLADKGIDVEPIGRH